MAAFDATGSTICGLEGNEAQWLPALPVQPSQCVQAFESCPAGCGLAGAGGVAPDAEQKSV